MQACWSPGWLCLTSNQGQQLPTAICKRLALCLGFLGRQGCLIMLAIHFCWSVLLCR
jgi:hypothetical protein